MNLFNLDYKKFKKVFGKCPEAFKAQATEFAINQNSKGNKYALEDCVISEDGEVIECQDDCTIGIRPCISLDDLPEIKAKSCLDKTLKYVTFEFGEFCNSQVVDKDLIYTLEKLLKTEELYSTNKIYYLDERRVHDEKEERRALIDDYYLHKTIREAIFSPCEAIEFMYNGEKYVRTGMDKWFKVQSIEWIANVKAGIAISKNILISGFYLYNDKFIINSNTGKERHENMLDIYTKKYLTNEISPSCDNVVKLSDYMQDKECFSISKKA